MITENTAIPIDVAQIKEKSDYTTYVQKPDIAQKIVSSLPSNSAIKLRQTSQNDTPLDDES